MNYKLTLEDINKKTINVHFDITEEELKDMESKFTEKQINEFAEDYNLTYEKAKRGLAEYYLYMFKLNGHE